MQSSQVYSIPVPYHDLRQPFVLKEIIHQLDLLDTVASDVVNRLQFKIESQTKRLQSINSVRDQFKKFLLRINFNWNE